MSMLALLLAASTAWGADTWIYYNTAGGAFTSGDVGYLTSSLTAAGASVTTTTSSNWPTDWTGYRLVILILPGGSFSPAQASALESFVDGGGRLVVAGESSIFGAYNGHANDLMSSLGSNMRLGSDLLAPGCTAGGAISPDQLTARMSRFYLAGSNTVSGGTPLLMSGSSVVAAVDQPSSVTSPRTPYDVVLLGDGSILVGTCSSARSNGSNYTFWQNLYVCEDGDGDGYTNEECGGTDCDDVDPAIHRGATEIPYDGVDDDCDGSDLTDVDGDGSDSRQVPGGDDCDDSDPLVYPGAAEIPDGVDQDCDGIVDEGTTAYDDDGDGFSEDAGDCDDADASINPDAEEDPSNGLDDDCDGEVDNASGDTSDPENDTGGHKDPADGCGCASAPAGGLPQGWLAGVLAVVGIRRRRADA